MPFYHDSVFGPSEHSQLRRHTTSVLSSPVDDRPRPALQRTSLPPPSTTDDEENEKAGTSPRRPFRVPREVMSPAPSPIPISPTYYSYRDDEDHQKSNFNSEEEEEEQGEAEVVVDADELRVDEGRHGAHRHHHHRTSQGQRSGPPQPSEKYLSLPRGHDVGADATSSESSGADSDARSGRRGRRQEGLVSSRPRSSPTKKKAAAAVGPSARVSAKAKSYIEEDEAEEEEGARPPPRSTQHASAGRPTHHSRRRHRHRSSRHRDGFASSSSSSTDTEEGERDGMRARKGERNAHPSPDPSSRKGRHAVSIPAHRCKRCGYALPAEMAAYLLETSTYASVPQPHCPACGCRLALATAKGRRPRGAASDEEEGSSDGHDDGPQRHHTPQRKSAVASSAKPRRSPVKNTEEEVNLYSDPEEEEGEGGARAAEYRTAAATMQRGRHVTHVPSPVQQHTIVLVPKSPYLTLDFMPRGLATTMKKPPHASQREEAKAWEEEEEEEERSGRAVQGRHQPAEDLEHTGVPWATPCCSACCWQFGVSLAGVCCCCAMPCVLFRERQQLLFHELESRYICCAGAFSCCVPPPVLRPELHYTVQSVPQRARGPHYWGDSVEVSREEEGSGGTYSGRTRRLSGPPATASSGMTSLRSATGIASPASLVNPRTGLPLEGCYHNTNSQRDAAVTGCCDCVSCVHHTCVWDCSRGCGLTCKNPTAHCLACPLCCLCCELTFCMPCALWANRLLIRQHYNLAPDPAIDGCSGCCYSCCLACCTCQAVSVVSKHQQQLSETNFSRRSTAKAFTTLPSSLSCWSQLASSVAACLAAVCCLCPCAACSLAQQKEQMERLGYPLVVELPPEMEML